MSTDDVLDIEDRLRAALAARAELVRPEDLGPVAPVVPLRPGWRSPWVLLATAAAVLLVLGVVLRGLTPDPRSDDVAPRPEQRLELPQDVGRDWRADEYSTPERLDLDGDGTKERVDFRSEETKSGGGRVRLEATLSGTGEETFGVVTLSSNITVNALGAIDADSDGDDELVLYDGEAAGGPGSPVHPLVLDLREGLLVEAVVDQPELLQQGNIAVPGSRTPYYELEHTQSYWIEGGTLLSSRSVRPFASGGMSTTRPRSMVLDSWRWRLDESGVLRPEDNGCLVEALDPERVPCPPGARDSLPEVAPVATGSFAAGEQFRWTEGYRYVARLDDSAGPVLVVEGEDGRTIDHPLEVADPVVLTTQPTQIYYDGASFVVRSASDPSYLQVLYQRGERLVVLEPVGEVPLAQDETGRTWLTEGGALVTVVPEGDGTWRAWFWQMVSKTEMAALPAGVLCFDDVADPSTARDC